NALVRDLLDAADSRRAVTRIAMEARSYDHRGRSLEDAGPVAVFEIIHARVPEVAVQVEKPRIEQRARGIRAERARVPVHGSADVQGRVPAHWLGARATELVHAGLPAASSASSRSPTGRTSPAPRTSTTSPRRTRSASSRAAVSTSAA